MASMYGALFFLAQYLQTTLGYGPLEAGWRLMPWTGVLMVGGPIAGRLVDRFGSWALLTSGLALHGGALLAVAGSARVGLGYGYLLVPLLVGGLGISLALPAAEGRRERRDRRRHRSCLRRLQPAAANWRRLGHRRRGGGLCRGRRL
jgi:hypothetical protein